MLVRKDIPDKEGLFSAKPGVRSAQGSAVRLREGTISEMKNCIKYICVCILFLQCNSQPKKIMVNEKLIKTDTIQYLSNWEAMNQFDHRLNEYFGFDSLRNKKNRFEIRMTRAYQGLAPIRFFVLKCENGVWDGFTASLILDIDKKNDKGRYIPTETISRPPKMGWDAFAEKILAMGILRIYKDIDMGNHPSYNDTQLVSVEYMANGEYRYYVVEEPDLPDTPGREIMAQILKLIENELHFKGFYSIQ
ncbi:MAG: hypothetical protein JNN00_09490 [Chitinophagaceae bacterium]|nr:hypothetical protein [Chitinophagaceae bacterium]